jgi:hypothetical protein
MTTKIKVNKKAATAYAELRGIDIEGLKGDKMMAAIKKAVDDNPKKEELFDCTTCGFGCSDSDTFCARCGADVTESAPDDAKPGDGLKNYLASLKTEKPAEKKEEKPAEKKTEKPKGPAKHDSLTPDFEPDDDRSLDERVKMIRELDQSTGAAAHNIGHELYQIKEGKKFVEGGHETFKDFCTNVLGFSTTWADGCIVVFENLKLDQATALGVSKAVETARAPAAIRKKVLTAIKGTKPEQLKGQLLTKNEIKTMAKEQRDKEREANGDVPQPAGRPAASKYKAALELKPQTKKPPKGFADGGVEVLYPLDHKIAVEVSFTDKGSLRIQCVELADDEAE